MQSNMSNNNQMIVIPILTPYGTQLVPMPMNQILANGNVNGMDAATSLNNLALQQQTALLNNVSGARNIQQLQNQMRNLQMSQNPIVSSILQPRIS
jgi:hypothetical protein